MTNKEEKMYEIIRENPQIPQDRLAEMLGITRSSVSVHISNLMKKGYISGRGYILNEPEYITVIGAANIDIIGRSTDLLIPEDSNPGSIRLCAGGVGRNISENLTRLSVNVKLISALGSDAFGKRIIEMSESVGIDMNHCFVREGAASSTYLAILENNGEMKLALSDMSILGDMPVEHINKKQQLINNSEIVVLDAGLPEATVEYILANFSGKRMFLDPVSVGKAKHVKNLIGGFDTVKLNRLEAEFLSGLSVTDRGSLERAGEYFLNKGVKRVFISMGREGVFYKTVSGSGVCQSPYITPVNATGAGDAFMAGIVYCTLHGRDDSYTARFASAMARIALMSENTVSPYMSVDRILREMDSVETTL